MRRRSRFRRGAQPVVFMRRGEHGQVASFQKNQPKYSAHGRRHRPARGIQPAQCQARGQRRHEQRLARPATASAPRPAHPRPWSPPTAARRRSARRCTAPARAPGRPPRASGSPKAAAKAAGANSHSTSTSGSASSASVRITRRTSLRPCFAGRAAGRQRRVQRLRHRAADQRGRGLQVAQRQAPEAGRGRALPGGDQRHRHVSCKAPRKACGVFSSGKSRCRRATARQCGRAAARQPCVRRGRSQAAAASAAAIGATIRPPPRHRPRRPRPAAPRRRHAAAPGWPPARRSAVPAWPRAWPATASRRRPPPPAATAARAAPSHQRPGHGHQRTEADDGQQDPAAQRDQGARFGIVARQRQRMFVARAGHHREVGRDRGKQVVQAELLRRVQPRQQRAEQQRQRLRQGAAGHQRQRGAQQRGAGGVMAADAPGSHSSARASAATTRSWSASDRSALIGRLSTCSATCSLTGQRAPAA